MRKTRFFEKFYKLTFSLASLSVYSVFVVLNFTKRAKGVKMQINQLPEYQMLHSIPQRVDGTQKIKCTVKISGAFE